jgi:hypothetical protein
MGRAEEDFEKGEASGSVVALDAVAAAAEGWSEIGSDGDL